MRRRVNSTGRRRLERRHVQITVRRPPTGGRPLVAARFTLGDLGLPPDARIVIEPYRHGFSERLEYGTIVDPQPRAEPVLEELGDEGLLFRVKVVDAQTGRLLALGREFRAGAEEVARRELFRVRTADLGQEPWRVELEPPEAPALVLNSRIPDVAQKLRTPVFRALVLPAAMRTVLLQLWWRGIEPEADDEPDESWSRRWLDFAAGLAGDEPPAGDAVEAMLDWIDRACTSFAGRHHLVDQMLLDEDRPEVSS